MQQSKSIDRPFILDSDSEDDKGKETKGVNKNQLTLFNLGLDPDEYNFSDLCESDLNRVNSKINKLDEDEVSGFDYGTNEENNELSLSQLS